MGETSLFLPHVASVSAFPDRSPMAQRDRSSTSLVGFLRGGGASYLVQKQVSRYNLCWRGRIRPTLALKMRKSGKKRQNQVSKFPSSSKALTHHTKIDSAVNRIIKHTTVRIIPEHVRRPEPSCDRNDPGAECWSEPANTLSSSDARKGSAVDPFRSTLAAANASCCSKFTFLREILEIPFRSEFIWPEKPFKKKKSLNFDFLQEQIQELVSYTPSCGGDVSLWFCVFLISQGLIYIDNIFGPQSPANPTVVSNPVDLWPLTVNDQSHMLQLGRKQKVINLSF